MKKEYESVELEVVRLEAEDVITASGTEVNTTISDDCGNDYIK